MNVYEYFSFSLIVMTFVTPVVAGVLLKRMKQIPGGGFSRFVILVAMSYALLLGSVQLKKTSSAYEYLKFDTNQNGWLDGKEITPESEAAVRKASTDTGLALAPITGGALIFVYSLIIFHIFGLRNRDID